MKDIIGFYLNDDPNYGVVLYYFSGNMLVYFEPLYNKWIVSQFLTPSDYIKQNKYEEFTYLKGL